MQLFFVFVFLGKKTSTRHAYQWSRQNEDFGRDLEVLDVLPRGPRIGILDMFPRGSLKLNFGRAS